LLYLADMELEVNLLGGGFVRMSLDANTLEDVAELLRRERALIGRSEVADSAGGVIGDCFGRILIPAQRVQMIREV
jgi:hypothetical protein